MDRLPIIDVGPLAEPGGPGFEAAARAVDAAAREIGFFLVTGPGVDPADLRALDAAARRFFALPAEVKATVAMARGGRAWRGWFPEGGELTSGRPDRKEGLYLGADLPAEDPRVLAGLALHGPNLLPDEHVPELRPAVDRWLAAMTDLGHRLLRGVAAGLGLAPAWFARHLTADPTVLFRIFRYPPVADRDGWGVAEHTDYGLLTILAHDGRSGLQVRAGDGWLEVPAVDGAFVVNLGDMLDRLTGGRYRSTPHRVVRSPDDGDRGDRLSFPFFFDPGWDAEVVAPPLDGVPPPDDRDRRWDGASVHAFSGTYGEYLTEKVAKVFPDLGTAVLDRR